MKAADVMVSPVITVAPDDTVQTVAEILLANRISGVPVVDTAGALIGIVSEGDLMRRADGGTEHHRSWWLSLLMGREGLAAEYVRENSRTVIDVMTREVITASPDTPVAKIAELLERNRIKRVPITRDGKIVGIVSRANLLQALAGLGKQITIDRPTSDAALRDKILNRLHAEPWAQTSLINVIVSNGSVDLWGIVESPIEKKALRVAVEVTPGVRSVNDQLTVQRLANVM